MPSETGKHSKKPSWRITMISDLSSMRKKMGEMEKIANDKDAVQEIPGNIIMRL